MSIYLSTESHLALYTDIAQAIFLLNGVLRQQLLYVCITSQLVRCKSVLVLTDSTPRGAHAASPTHSHLKKLS